MKLMSSLSRWISRSPFFLFSCSSLSLFRVYQPLRPCRGPVSPPKNVAEQSKSQPRSTSNVTARLPRNNIGPSPSPSIRFHPFSMVTASAPLSYPAPSTLISSSWIRRRSLIFFCTKNQKNLLCPIYNSPCEIPRLAKEIRSSRCASSAMRFSCGRSGKRTRLRIFDHLLKIK